MKRLVATAPDDADVNGRRNFMTLVALQNFVRE